MPCLRDAFVMALTLNRNPSLLSVDNYSRQENSEFGKDCLCLRGDIVGGSEPHHAIIVLPNNPPIPAWKPVTINRMDDAKWHCDCSDFRFTFYPFIDQNGFRLLEFEPYIPNGRGAPRAIDSYGMCKHVMALVNKLVHDRVLSPQQFMKE